MGETEERRIGREVLIGQVSNDVRRMTNLVAIGHGTALLLVFNARIEHGFSFPIWLWFVPYLFALGLAAAFLAQHMIYIHDLHNVLPEGERIEPSSRRTAYLARHQVYSRLLFWGSAILFILALLVSVTLLSAPGR